MLEKISEGLGKYELFENTFANKEQREAIDSIEDFLKNSEKDEYMLIGRGGTGKTTILKKVIEPFKKTHKVALAAPSNAAVKVLDNAFSDVRPAIPSFTVASILGMKLNKRTNKFEIDKFQRQKYGLKIEKFDIIIVDEASMIDESLKSYISKYKSDNAKVIYVGDSAQLPPIRPSNTLFTDKDSPVFDIKLQSKLVERMRQGEESPIVPVTDVFANNIDKGKKGEIIAMRPLNYKVRETVYDEESDKGVVFVKDGRKALDCLIQEFKREESKDDSNYVKAVVYTNDLRNSINRYVRNALWGKNADKYVVGEKVISFSTYVDANLEPVVFNSDNFIIDKISKGKILDYSCLWLTLKNDYGSYEVPVVAPESIDLFKARLDDLAKFNSWKSYYNLLDLFADIQYGYAITSHKSQGSTFNKVYVFEDDIMGVPASPKTKNQSMYVATSRPSNLLVIHSAANPSNEDSDNFIESKLNN